LGELTELFTHQLGYNQFRVFQKGNVMVSILNHDRMLIVASTAFDSTDPSSNVPRGIDIIHRQPRLQPKDVLLLQQLSVPGLRALAADLGSTVSGESKEALAHSIGNIIPPVDPNVLLQSPNNPPEEEKERQITLNKYKVPQLKALCHQAGIRLTGNQSDLVQRILDYEYRSKHLDQLKAQLEQFVAPTKSVVATQQPVINQYYRERFNLVDRFNRMLSECDYNVRAASQKKCVFYWLVQVAISNSYALYCEKQSQSIQPFELSLRDFGRILCGELKEECNRQ
jgi:hypothetical protein